MIPTIDTVMNTIVGIFGLLIVMSISLAIVCGCLCIIVTIYREMKKK